MKTITIVALLALTSCAAPVQNWERNYFSTVTNKVPQTIYITNLIHIPIVETNVVEVRRTNEVGVIVPVFMTNVITREVTVTNFAMGTNWVLIEQLAPSPKTQATVEVGKAVAAPFGWGEIVGYGLAALLTTYMTIRNRKLAGQASMGALTAGVLTQNIETLLNVLEQTPQGQQLKPIVKNYLMQHQNEFGVIENVAKIIETSVDEPSAKESATSILKAITSLKA